MAYLEKKGLCTQETFLKPPEVLSLEPPGKTGLSDADLLYSVEDQYWLSQSTPVKTRPGAEYIGKNALRKKTKKELL